MATRYIVFRKKETNALIGFTMESEDLPRRCDTKYVGGMGECLHCDADQGEHCKKPEMNPFTTWAK